MSGLRAGRAVPACSSGLSAPAHCAGGNLRDPSELGAPRPWWVQVLMKPCEVFVFSPPK